MDIVSIVTPLYNHDRYICETAESVVRQKFDSIEYFIIDDGSTDNSWDLIQQFSEVASITHQENRGQAATLNRGWSAASGEFLGYLSSDDLLEEDAISILIDELRSDNECVLVYPDFKLIDGNGDFVRDVSAPEFDLNDLTVGMICQPGVGALFRREAFEKAGGWDTDLQQVADFEFFLRLSKHGSFKRIPLSLARHRVHPESASFRPISTKRADEIIVVCERYWSGHDDERSRQARANANIIASRMHARSGRIVIAIERLVVAYRLNPELLKKPGIPMKILYQYFRRPLFGLLRR